jgi:antitoxin component of MazEF toxin-antitoxin module
MSTIDTTITTSGNSAAVRLPRELLRMSGLNAKSKVRLSAKKNQIITKNTNPRECWEEQIEALLADEGDPGNEFADMQAADSDGLSGLPWEGPSFQEWQKTYGKVS